MNASGIVFQNPAAWAGAAALGLPLLVHLMTRRTPRRIVFPTIRFLHRAQSNMTSLFRVRHLLLLLVRTLAVLAILVAFLRPSLFRGPLAAADPKARQRVAILIVDGSLSMAYSRGGGGPWARARQAALQVIDSLAPSDRGNLIVACAQPRPTFDEPSSNFFQLRREAQDLQPSLERADLDAAIGEALRQLDAAKGMRHEIYFISDFQRSNWENAGLNRIRDSVVTTFVSVAETDARNLAVTDVRVTPGNPMGDEPVAVVCKVANYGTTASRVPLRLSMGDEPPLERDLEVRPGATALATFRIRAHQAGAREATVRISADDLPADDARYFVLPVGDRIEALVLTDEPAGSPRASHRFLCRALDPYGAAAAGGDDRPGAVRCTVRAPEALTRFDLDRAHVVFVCGVGEMASGPAQMLLDYLGRGGGVAMFVESPADRANLAAWEALSKKEFALPVDFGGSVERRPPATFGAIGFDDALLRPLRGLTELGDLHFTRYFATPPTATEATVILRYDDGNIAVTRQQWRLGTLLLCNFTPSPDGGDLVKRTPFVPLMHEFCQALRPQGGVWRTFQAGGSCDAVVAVTGTDPLPVLCDPDGQPLDAVIEANQGEAMMAYPRTLKSGFYHVRSGDRVLASIPVNVDSRESNLESLTAGEVDLLAKTTGSGGRQSVAVRSGVPLEMGTLLKGRIVWHWVLLAGLVLLATEQALTLVWRR